MSGVQIDTRSGPFALVANTNTTASSFTDPVPRMGPPTEPGTHLDGILEFGARGGATANAAILVPFGTGTGKFSMNVFGWRELHSNQGNKNLWLPMLLASYTNCTLDAGLLGVAGTDLGASTKFCSAITLGIGNAGISEEIVSPGAVSGQMAHVIVDAKGCRFLQVTFAVDTATSANALWSKM